MVNEVDKNCKNVVVFQVGQNPDSWSVTELFCGIAGVSQDVAQHTEQVQSISSGKEAVVNTTPLSVEWCNSMDIDL